MSQITKTPAKLKEPTKYVTEFQNSYKKLNAAQKQAVDTIEGPVMVIAGPGTGKTETVAVRVANILKKTQMRPGNILCLTFSTSGAKAMRERLRKIIGHDAYGVTVETVHGFCNDVILQHPHLFEDFRALEQVSEIERLRIVRSGMGKLEVGSILGKPSRENDRASAILNRISEMKREGITPDKLTKLVPTYQKEIEVTKNGKERNKSTQAYKYDCRLVQQFKEFITLYHEYNEELIESHRYDYDDMILICNKALREHDWLLAALQERYQYILVDEFQDLNGAQNSVIETLLKEPAPNQLPNVFVVGDDDQAIYRFQGANIGNMMEFLKRFPNTKIITLTDNYRSSQTILDSAASVIAHNEERLVRKVEGVEKTLVSKADHCDGTSPTFLRFPAIENEHAGIVEILKNAHEKGTPWNEMAVLCRRNEELADLYEVLLTTEIPAIITANQDLLLHAEVLQTIILLKAIEHLNTDHSLSTALSCKTFGVPPADLGRLWLAYRKQKRDENPASSLREFMMEAKLPSSLQNAYDLLEELHIQKDSITLPELLESILKKSHLLPPKEESSTDPRRIAGLHAFYDYVKNRMYENKALTLSILLSDLDQHLTERHLKLEYDMPHLVSDGIELMTAHGAKGLEFELVIIAHARERNWGNRISGSLLSLPDNLIFEIDADTEKNAKQEDERRLMYVAMTRAKKNLILTFPEQYRSGSDLRDAQPSSFIAEAGDTLEEISLPADDVPAPIETLYKPSLVIDEAFESYLREQLEDFKFSVTALNAFLEDPQEFLWTHLLLQPQSKAPHLAFGSSVHAALEKRNLAQMHKEAFTTDDLIATFEMTMHEREIFTEKEREHFLHEGRVILKRYGEQTQDSNPIIHSTERSLSARWNDIPLTGKVDRIDLFNPDGATCRIIDYKTGMPKKTEAAIRKDEKLFRQLVFYKLLCDLSPSFSHEATVFTLDFIGNMKEERRIIDFEITDEEVKELKEVIKNVWEKLMNLDFTQI